MSSFDRINHRPGFGHCLLPGRRAQIVMSSQSRNIRYLGTVPIGDDYEGSFSEIKFSQQCSQIYTALNGSDSNHFQISTEIGSGRYSCLFDQIHKITAKCLAILNSDPQTAWEGVFAAVSHNAFATYTVPFAIECFTGTVLLVGFNVDTIRL